MTIYHIYLEEDADGRCLAHVPDLAGCIAAGENRAEALDALPAAIQRYLDWCGAHGDPVPQDNAIDLAVVETQRGYGPWRRGSANALFSVDRAPLADPELRTYLRRLSYAHADLLAWVRALPEGGLDAPAPARGGTVRETLGHIADSELFYLSRMGQRISMESEPEDVLSRLIDCRARAVEAILRLSPRQRDLVYVPTEQPSDDPEEGWTLRKVLRRMLEHELEHLHALQAADITRKIAG